MPPELVALLLLWAPAASGLEAPTSQCVEIKEELCKGIGYNFTAPAVASRSDIVSLESFLPLINVECSKSLRFFLCSVRWPMCSPQWHQPIGPCRPLCQHVHRRCNPVLSSFGFVWPAFLNCSLFPATNGEVMCMEGNVADDSEQDEFGKDLRWRQDSGRDLVHGLRPSGGGGGGGGGRGGFEAALRRYRRVEASDTAPPDCGHLRNRRQYRFLNHTGRCALACDGHDLFSEEDRRLAELWMATLASLCAVSSLATILTFLIDRRRFKYPLRPVVFMALCYLCYSLSYFVRLAAGREAAACETDPLTGSKVLTQRGLDNTNCAVVFLLQYFFSTAASAWYVILVLTWLLQAGWKWSPEAVARRSCYFHLPAWIVPVSLTVFVLIVRRVEADELFGMCNVGNQNSKTLLTFVIIPNVAFLLLELVFLVAGLVAMSQVRRHVKLDGQKTNKFDVLMGKIGLFSALYVIPTACVTGFNIHEYVSRDWWHVPGSRHQPSVAAFLIRTFASLAIGLTTVMWICSCKTVQSWRAFLLPASLVRDRGAARGAKAYHLTADEELHHQLQQQQQQLQHGASPGSQSKLHYMLKAQHQHQQHQQLRPQGQSTVL